MNTLQVHQRERAAKTQHKKTEWEVNAVLYFNLLKKKEWSFDRTNFKVTLQKRGIKPTKKPA